MLRSDSSRNCSCEYPVRNTGHLFMVPGGSVAGRAEPCLLLPLTPRWAPEQRSEIRVLIKTLERAGARVPISFQVPVGRVPRPRTLACRQGYQLWAEAPEDVWPWPPGPGSTVCRGQRAELAEGMKAPTLAFGAGAHPGSPGAAGAENRQGCERTRRALATLRTWGGGCVPRDAAGKGKETDCPQACGGTQPCPQCHWAQGDPLWTPELRLEGRESVSV